MEEGKFWIYKNHENPDSPSAVSGHAITILGDTSINSVNYKKVYLINLKGENPCPPWESPCWEFDIPYQSKGKSIISLIREDTISRKIYNLPSSIYDFCETDEYLLLDYSLNLGDTLNACAYENILPGGNAVQDVGIVDSIKIVDAYGKSRNTIHTLGFYNGIGLPQQWPIQILEGVGLNTYGIFYFWRSIFVDYCEGEIEQCNLILSNENVEIKNEIKIFPNPSNGIFQISINQENLKSIKVYSILGQLKKELKLTNSVDLSALENGIYIMEILTKDNKRITKKIKKEN